jgi:CO/xanthine dehydrogenase Mo-binding subunit
MAVGKSVIREDAFAKATGKAIYVADMKVPGMLVGKILHSKIPFGRIRKLDIEPAKKIPGVFAVISASGIPGKNLCHIVLDDMPLLAKDYVRYVGEAIAVVAAENERAAEDALDSIVCEIEPLIPLTDFEKWNAPDSPILYGEDNLFAHHKIRKGDVEKGFAESDVVIERAYRTGYQEHLYLETQGMLAIPLPDGGIEVYGSMQCPFYVHGTVADVTGLAQARVRVVQTTTGGGFGGKEDVPSLVAGWASVAAMSSGRPVKLILERSEDMISMSKRHPNRTKIKIGAKKNGELIAVEVDTLYDAGAYATLSPIVLWRGLVHSCGAYQIPNTKVDARAVATNKVPCGAYRGFGSPQVLFAIESAIDELAKELAIEPVEFRKKNILRVGSTTATNHRLTHSVGLEECLEKALAASDYFQLKEKLHNENGAIKRGLGVSTIFYGVGLGAGGKKLARTGAYVSIQQDGSAQFAVGTTEMGQGMRTVLGQIVAESFGIPYEKISSLPVDTTRVPDSGPTVASRSTTMSGRALLLSCETLKRNLAKAAAQVWNIDDKSVSVANGRAFRTDEPSLFMEWGELVKTAHAQNRRMATVELDTSPATSWLDDSGQGDAYVIYSFAANIALVSVDTRTGVAKVEKLWAAHDIGKAINPQQVEGQIEGGSTQGIGYALFEEYIIDENGIPLNPKLAFYHIPTTMDAPEFTPIIVEHPYEFGPFGAKGFGEQPLMGIAPAVANAIADAIGLRLRRQPMTPEKIWEGLKVENNAH